MKTGKTRPTNPGAERFLGLDVGAETIKLVELRREDGNLALVRREIVEHGKKPGQVLRDTLRNWNWPGISRAAVTGRFSVQVNLPGIPVKQALLRGYRFLFGDEPATIVNIGSHGFSVLEVRANGLTVFRENSRCSQGTGNFLRQLVERFSLTVEEASVLCADVPNPAPLSGRCPVILKTDMTHLANKGEDRARILAGLFDAVCENVAVLVKPGVSPARVLLTGGVSRSPRVRRVFGELLAKQGMTLVKADGEQLLCLEALGCAIIASENPATVPGLDNLLLPPRELKLERLPALATSLNRVRRMPKSPWAKVNGEMRRLVIGFDIGSTGAKAVALDLATREIVWDSYRQTLGNPVGAAQDLLRRFTEHPAAKYSVVAFGATGSGREVAGSLLNSCYGKDAVFIVNEIVAHATGALHFDPRVDTIFEIGGQDAKYTRLAEGRIIDCAMNEACSAGTGSFIEEQGGKFSGIGDVCQLGQAALAAPGGVSLGQHCSVFMAEVIDEAVAVGEEQSGIISGLYDSIIKNYLNRVKGNRSIGKVIFCQGMPFSADALAAAVARQTGCEVIVPPNPGTVGALGIAMLAARELDAASLAPLEPARFLGAKVEQKDTFVCGSNRGCGGAGNHCRIERLGTIVAGQRSKFTWGGGCSLYDKGTRKRKLPDLAPDPFREREARLQQLLATFAARRSGPRMAMSDEFMLKGLFPFFAAYFHAAGFDLEIAAEAGPDVLKQGIQSAHAPFCAPMQLYHGVAQQLAAGGADWMFVPMIRNLPGEPARRSSVICPIVQGAPKVVERGCSPANARRPRMLSPVIDFGAGNLESKEFLASCARLANELDLDRRQQQAAWSAGYAAQREFDVAGQESSRRALEFCRAHNVVPVVVLGRDYTIYNKVLNSNVPVILREQGAIGIPVDCLPLEAGTPMFTDMYWGYGQTILRAAHQVRRMAGVYALYCSNYSCGPDSFNLHFAAYAMAGKPFVVIETDGHSGDAGTRTRVEAFLHCVDEDRRFVVSPIPVAQTFLSAGSGDFPVASSESWNHNARRNTGLESPVNPQTGMSALRSRAGTQFNNFENVQFSGLKLGDFRDRNGKSETMLVSHIGAASDAVAAVFRGLGLNAESLPAPDGESLRIGRRYTSGKECLPMPFTLGSLVQRLDRAAPDEKFVYLMPSTDGPCRFGVYNLLNNIVLDRLGWRDRVRIWSPKDTGYFDDMPPGTEVLVFAGIAATDLLLQARFDVRPFERERGATDKLYERCLREMLAQIETAAHGDLSLGPALWQAAGGRLFGLRKLLQRAAREFAALRGPGQRPCVELTGEIYVRGVDFSNDFLIEKLEARGLRVHLAPKTEWINYCGFVQRQTPGRNRVVDGFSQFVRRRIESAALSAMAGHLGWAPLPTPEEAMAAAKPYVHEALYGEAVLTVGAPLHEYRHGHIDAVVSVGPLECMPTKIAEAQWHHVAEDEGMLSLTLPFNGDPVSSAALDNFAFEVKERFNARRNRPGVNRFAAHGSPTPRGTNGVPKNQVVLPSSRA
jgi:activator of 2-hydroxyglutaryl-CoA dehydratase/predicted nucleotide-binding protein (sugar kinase/HSP70/actin superfamily)